MSEKNKINFEDFKLENLTNPDYTPEGVITEPIEEPKVEPTPEPKKEEKVAKAAPNEPIKPNKELEVDPGLEDDPNEEEIPVELPDTIDFKPFYNLFHEKLGWEVPEDEMPENSMEGLIGYLNDLVEKSSTPKYSNEIVANFDKFVANGGDPKIFMQTMFGSRDYSKINVETASEFEKKQTLSEYLAKTNPGKDSAWIDKKVQRYEDSGVLDDEFADAVTELNAMDAKEKAELVASKERERQAQAEAYQQQLRDLENTITNKKDIAGIPVNQKEMKDFYAFLTKPEKDGYTAYEKVLSEDREAVIKMAYVAFKKFDVNNLKTNVKSDVVKDVKKALSRFSSTNNGLQSRTGIPQKSNNMDYKAFDLGL